MNKIYFIDKPKMKIIGTKKARQQGVSKSAISRRKNNMILYGTECKPEQQKERKKKLSLQDLQIFFWFKSHNKSATLVEVGDFLRDCTGKTVSLCTLQHAKKELGLTRKLVHHFSGERDERDRMLFWINKPDDLIRPGVSGINIDDLVDIDEAGRCLTDTNRKFGDSIAGLVCAEKGRGKREGKRLTFAVAVDTRVGVISRIIYNAGTTNDKFYSWMKLNVLEMLRGTGRRIIVMDNLSSHLTPELQELIASYGHCLVLRPTHSPDFGGIEWVFHFVTNFLQHHRLEVNDSTIRTALISCFDLVTKNDIKGYMADAHFYVEGYTYKPYLNSQASSIQF